MTAPVNPEGQTAREPKAEWRVVGAAANRCVNVATGDGDAVAIVYGNAAHLETAYQRAVAICAARNAGQTPQEVRRAALEEAAERVQRQPWWRDSGQAAAAIRALASTPSPAKQTEQKIADQKGGGADEARSPVADGGAASQLGAAPATSPGSELHGLIVGGSVKADPAYSAAAQPDARDAEIARLRLDLANAAKGRDFEREQRDLRHAAYLEERDKATRLTKELEEARANAEQARREFQAAWDTGVDLNTKRLAAEAQATAPREALTDLVAVIEKAGLLNLSNGVQLGQTSWFVKASDALAYAKRVLAPHEPKAETPAETPITDLAQAMREALARRGRPAETAGRKEGP